MSRIDPLRGRLGRRDLLKMTGAAAGVAALGDLTGRGLLPARSALARQDGGERDHLRRRHRHRRARPAHDRHPGRLYRRLERLRLPGALRSRRDHDPTRPRRVVGDLRRRARLHLQSAPGREVSTTASRSTPTPSSPGTTRSTEGAPGYAVRRDRDGLHRGLHHDLDRHRRGGRRVHGPHDPA